MAWQTLKSKFTYSWWDVHQTWDITLEWKTQWIRWQSSRCSCSYDCINNDGSVLVWRFALTSVLTSENNHKRKRKRELRVQPWMLERKTPGVYHALRQELNLSDLTSPGNFLRTDNDSFNILLAKWHSMLNDKPPVCKTAFHQKKDLPLPCATW